MPALSSLNRGERGFFFVSSELAGSVQAGARWAGPNPAGNCDLAEIGRSILRPYKVKGNLQNQRRPTESRATAARRRPLQPSMACARPCVQCLLQIGKRETARASSKMNRFLKWVPARSTPSELRYFSGPSIPIESIVSRQCLQNEWRFACHEGYGVTCVFWPRKELRRRNPGACKPIRGGVIRTSARNSGQRGNSDRR